MKPKQLDLERMREAIVNYVKENIKSACEFYWRYEDKPELLWEDAEVLGKIKLSKKEKKSLWNILLVLRDSMQRDEYSEISEILRGYNDLLFTLTFQSVFEEDDAK